MNPHDLIDLRPALHLLAMAGVLSLLPLAWWGWRHRKDGPAVRRAGLTVLTLFLTFDLVVFGAFTRLTDSGLGCPDWPGCYGEASPLGAQAPIAREAAARPSGPVTSSKAWVEMIHRYLAMTVGALIALAAVLATRARRKLPYALAWPWLTLAWVMVQGAFGKYTVTLKLYPAIVTLHLLGGLILLALLVFQAERDARRPLAVPALTRRGLSLALAVLTAQVLLGAWVSTNYAVLACQGFPQCNGQWWPAGMDAARGFELLRHLGRTGDGDFLPAPALVAIHWAHRLGAVAAAVVLGGVAMSLWRTTPSARRPALQLAGLLALQVLTGAANVVLQWPLVAALLHTAGAALLAMLLVSLRTRVAAGHARPAGSWQVHAQPAPQ